MLTPLAVRPLRQRPMLKQKALTVDVTPSSGANVAWNRIRDVTSYLKRAYPFLKSGYPFMVVARLPECDHYALACRIYWRSGFVDAQALSTLIAVVPRMDRPCLLSIGSNPTR